jgi:peptidoglycan hydrolase-like protein with peptidoglycan-binding domain
MPRISSAHSTRAFTAASSTPTLRFGARGPSVVRLQQLLARAGCNPHGADGVFGPNTQAAVLQFQRSRGLTVDGIVGPRTWAALERGASPVGGAQPGDHFSPAGSKSVTGYVNGMPRHITVAPVGNGQYLRTDAAQAFKQMQADARRHGITLSATSGFRTMEQQQHLYWLWTHHQGNLAARPGYSNHQGGVAMDIGGLGGYGSTGYRWLASNARRYGFVNDVGGEPWHWTYKR